MKRITALIATVLFTGMLLANSPHNIAIRPTAYYVKPTAGEYSGALAGGLLIGSEFGLQKEHEVSTEWAYTWWDSSASVPGISLSAREHYMPFLVNYRYHFGPQTQSFRVYAGPSVGFTYSKIDVNARIGSVRTNLSTNDWTLTVSGTIGALIKLSQSVSLDLGYRYLHTEAGTYSIGGYSFEGNAATAHMAYTGLNFRF